MLKMSHSSYPYFLMSSWILFLSVSTVLASADAASPCHFNCFKPCYSLKHVNQPWLNFNLSSSGIPTKSANLFHFWWRTSPVSRTPSPIAFKTHSSIISEMSGCSVCWTRLAVWSLFLFVWSHCSCHLALSLSQDETNGCFIQILG